VKYQWAKTLNAFGKMKTKVELQVKKHGSNNTTQLIDRIVNQYSA